MTGVDPVQKCSVTPNLLLFPVLTRGGIDAAPHASSLAVLLVKLPSPQSMGATQPPGRENGKPLKQSIITLVETACCH